MQPHNPYGQQQPYNPYAYPPPLGGSPQPIPNATAIMVLGICSIVLCGLGPILGTIALIMGRNAKQEYESKPGYYDPGSYTSVKAGRTCGIVGVCIGTLSWIIAIVYFVFMFWILAALTGIH